MVLANGGIYTIKNIGDGLRVSVNGSILTNSTNIIAHDDGKIGSNDLWVAIPCGDNKYKFQTQINGNSGQLLDENVTKSSADLYQKHGGTNQEWKIEPAVFQIKNVASGRVIQTGGQGQTINTIPQPGGEDKTTYYTLVKQ